MIVSPGVKVIAWILVVMVNFFFVFFSILRGLERGADWQRMFLMACIFRKFGHLPHLSPLPLVPPPSPPCHHSQSSSWKSSFMKQQSV
jgi:hypothetical protein